jgi:hypothetical protein
MAGKKKEQKEKKEKPLERRTVKELREEALTLPDVQGVHGMNKEELVSILSKAKGIEPRPQKKKKAEAVRDVKHKISELKKVRDEERGEGAARARLEILRKKISRLKKKTRREK